MSTVTYEQQYIQALKLLLRGALKAGRDSNTLVKVFDGNVEKSIRAAYDRTGTGRISTFGAQFKTDISNGKLPLLESKYIHLKSIVHELIWMLRGDSNIEYLKANGVRIWDEWADENGELGPVYGQQWRAWVDQNGNKIDQLSELLEAMIHKPLDTGHILTAWNVGELKNMALRPCHTLAQFYIEEVTTDGNPLTLRKISCQLYQRSADMFLGVPFNAVFYSLLTQWIASALSHSTGGLYAADSFVHTFGDMHIYKNHLSQVALQIQNYENLDHNKPTYAEQVRVGWNITYNKRFENLGDILVPTYDLLNIEGDKEYAANTLRIAGKVSV